MVIGKLLFEAAKYVAPRARQGYEYIYAVGAGTAIGIGGRDSVRQAYEMYRGKNYHDYDSWKRWDDKVLTKRFKGDVYIDETSNSQRETLYSVPYRPDSNRNSTKYRLNIGGGGYGRKYRKRGKRRKPGKGCICRTVVTKPRKSRRKYRYRK